MVIKQCVVFDFWMMRAIIMINVNAWSKNEH